MKTQNFQTRISAALVALVLLGGCKAVDDTVDTTQSSAGNGSAPGIWGEPDSSVLVGADYVFQPEAQDSDGDILDFSIANQPAWADFDAASGVLQGVPDSEHAGEHSDIVISVSDQTNVVSLPGFAITVTTAPVPEEDDDTTASSPPAIDGTPNASVVVDTKYSFAPDASDPDGDTLSFSIVNKPVWTTFSTTTGSLQGTPTASHVGTTEAIGISVTDGSSIAALVPFSIAVELVGTVSKTVSWTPPTENEDGSALTDLAGYRIYYGTSAGDLTEVIELASAGLTRYVIEDLVPGTYFLAMTSFNSGDLESRQTPEITFALGS